MADLRGKEIKDEYANLLTKGPNGEVQDGEGNDFILPLRGTFLALPQGTYIQLPGIYRRTILIFFGYGGGTGVSGIVHLEPGGFGAQAFTGVSTAYNTGIPDGTGDANKMTCFYDPLQGRVYFENQMPAGVDIVYLRLSR